jgi:exodeoxyribonuclease X
MEMMNICSPQQMIEWTAQPKLLPAIPFGKHRGSAWADVPSDYLQWMTRQSDMDQDVLWCAKTELDRRQMR